MSYSTFYLNSQSSDGIIDGSNVIIGGNVGIQTNTPEYSLDINGTFRSSSIVTTNINTENIILSDSSLNPYSIQSRIEHTKLVENIVTVGTKTSDAVNSSGSSSAFFIDNIETPYLHFTLGKKYRFIQTDSTNTGHPLRFYLDEDKTTQFTTNVTVSGTPGVNTSYVEISVTSSTPQILYYQCSSHSYMGNSAYSKSTSGLNNISISDLNDVSFNSITAADGNALVWNATSEEWGAGIIVSNKPAFQGVDLSGYDLLLKFTENIKDTGTYDPSDFTVNVKSVNRTVVDIAVANGDVNLIMDTGGQTGGVETLIGGQEGVTGDVDGSIEDSRFHGYLRGLSVYGDYLYVCTTQVGDVRRFNVVTRTWSTFIPHSNGYAIGGMTRDGINFYVVFGPLDNQKLVKYPMNYDNPIDTYANRVDLHYNTLPVHYITSFTMSNDGAYIYLGITGSGRVIGISRYTIATDVFEYYKTSGLTTNNYSSDQDYLLYSDRYDYELLLAIDDNYLYFGYHYHSSNKTISKIGRISLSTDVIELNWKVDTSYDGWFIGYNGTGSDDVGYQTMAYKDGYLYFNGPRSTGKIVKTSVNDSTSNVTVVGDYVGHIAVHPTLPYLYYAGFYQYTDVPYDGQSRKGTIWQLTLDVPSYQTFDPITSVDNLTIKYIKNSTSGKNLLGDPSDFVVDNFNYVGTDITGIINGADISFNVMDVSAIFIQGSNVSTVLNSKQATIEDGDLTIARTNGLQAALDAKVESAALINLKPTLTILDLSSGDILLNFTEGIKDVATYDKDDFVLTNEGTVITGGTISVENDKVKFAFSSGWREDTSVGSTKSWWGITSSADGTKLAATVQGGNIWTSTDSGASWTSRAASRNWYNGIASSTDGTKLVASENNGNIWTSTDSGVNWTSRASEQRWNGLASSADGTKLVSVAYNGNIWTSTDSGVNWTSRASVKYWVEVASSSDGTKLAAVVYNGNIWTSTDSGVNWTEQWLSFGGTKQWFGIASSADGTKLAAVVSGGNIWTSTNSGVNWTEQSASFGGTKIWRAIASSADGSKLVAPAYGGNIWTSTNSGVTWTEDTTVNATKNWRGIALSADGTKPVAAPNGGNLWTFESVEAPNITDVQNLTVKYTKSATANKNLLGKDTDVAVDSFDFIGTNRIQATITESIDVSLNNLKVHGDLSANDASFNVIDVSAIFIQGRDLVGDGVSEAMDTLKELADALDSSANFAANVTTRLATIESDLANKQTTISTNDLSLGDISGLYTQLASKQDTISTNDLSLGDISGLYTQLASKQDTISTNDLSLGDISGLYTQLASKQDTLTAGTNITITGNTISSSGGGGGSADITESSITDLSDVDISYSNISDGQALIWNDASGVWKPGTISSSSGTTIDSTTDISVNNLDISGVLATNKSNNQISLGGHIIPITNSTYDLGSAEYKIRHLYLSNNSLWLGEDHKIEVSDGKMKFRKLQKNALPSGLNAISGASLNDAISVLGKPVDTPASSFTLADWEAYSIAKGSPLRIDEIFLSDDINDDNGVLDTINGLDISLNVVDASMINVSGDISANNASFNVIDVNSDISFNGNLYQNGALFVGGSTIDETTDVSLNNLKVHGDLSANDASFNVIDTASINVTGDYQQNGANINTIYATIASPTLTGTPAAPTASSGTNTTQLATTAFVSTAVSNLVNGAPGALDTLSELASALDNSGNFATNVTNTLGSLQTQINTKQATLSFNAPSSNNTNPSTSAQIKTALDAKQDTLTAGTNITITGTTISASGGGGGLTDLSATSINDLSDVSFNSISTNQGSGLIWNNADKLWEPGTLTASITNTTTVTNSGGWVDKLATNTPSYDFFGDTVYDGNDTIYFVGGRENSSTVRNYVWGYTLSTNTWAQVTTTGTFRAQILEHAVIYYNNCIYVFGGWAGSGSNFNDLYKLDLTQSTPTWSLVSTGGSISIRRGPSVTMYNSKLIVFGGFASSSALNDVYEIDLIAGTPTWTQLHSGSGTAPSARYNTIIETYQNKFFIFSGSTKDQQCWEFDLTNNTWSQVSLSGTIPTGRVWSQHTIVDNNIYLYGGGHPTILNDFAVLNVLTGECSLIAANITVPQTRGHGLTYANNKIYLYGNNQSSTGYTFEYTIPLTTTTYNPVEINKLSTYYALSVGPNYDTTSLDNSGSLIVEGNVGIGISDPSGYKLEVAGDISFNGNLYQNGALFVGGSTIDETTDVSVNNLDVSGNLKVDGRIAIGKDISSQQIAVQSDGNEYEITFNSHQNYNNWVLFETSSSNGGWIPQGSDFTIEYEHTMTRGSGANYAHFGLFFEGTELSATSFGGTTYFMYYGISWDSSVTLRFWAGNDGTTNIYQETTTSSSPSVTLNYLTQNSVDVKYEYIASTDTVKLYFNGSLAGNINWSNANFGTKPYGKWGFGDWNTNSHTITNPRITINNITYTLTTIHSESDSNPTITGPTATGDSYSYYPPSLDVSGNGIFSGTVQASGNILSSDDRLKHNEVIPTTPLDTIMKLTPKQYFKTRTMYDISHNFQVNSQGIPMNTNGTLLIENNDYTRETGIIAQDLQLIPELKYTVKNNSAAESLGVDYNSIFCTHIAATKELNKTVNDQKLIIESQQQDIETLKLINQDMNTQLTDVLNENNSLKNDIQFIKNYLGIN